MTQTSNQVALAQVLERWEPVIGLEVHVQLATATKLFCRCAVIFAAAPNTSICPVCTGQPGSLPSLNSEAIRLGAQAGLALGCRISPIISFARKNYFYPDLPKGYQISQAGQPLCADGRLNVQRPDGTAFAVSITRAHLEEDTGKILHPAGMSFSLVDLNRSGSALLEIVSGADINSASDARLYLQQLRRSLRYAGSSACDLEKGQFRCDANLSLRPRGTSQLGTRTETKNLNSFAFVEAALEAEILRQAGRLDLRERVIQETMAYDPGTRRTRPLRTKEHAHDYRYFREPDLPSFAVPGTLVDSWRAALPEMPSQRIERYIKDFQISRHDAESIVTDRHLADWFEQATRISNRPASVATWLLNDVLRLLNERRIALHELALTPDRLSQLIELVSQHRVSLQAGRQLLPYLVDHPDRTAEQAATDLGKLLLHDVSVLTSQISDVLANSGDIVDRYHNGNQALLNALVGKVLAATGGRANPVAVKALILERIGSPATPDATTP